MVQKNSKIFIFNSVFMYGKVAFANKEVVKIFSKYNLVKNVMIINYVTFPHYMTDNDKYYCTNNLSKLVSTYEKEFIIWKKFYINKFRIDYKKI